MKKNHFRSRKISIFFLLLFSIFLIHFFFRVYQYKDNYLVPFDHNYWEKRYYESQWVVPNSSNTIGDDGLYAYAGYKYVFDGLNPILNSPEVPFLGKYLIGLTILIFNNQNIFGLLTGILALAVFYFFNLNIFKNKTVAFLPVFVFSFDMLFWEQLQANYLDLLYLSFLFLSLTFALKRNYILASIFLGCFAATKFPPTSILLGIAMLVYVILCNSKDIKKLLISFILWPSVYVITYLQFFFQGNNFIDFLKVQNYFINYYATGAKSQNPFMAIEMLMLGRWSTWWAGVMRVGEWHILWPISFVLSLGVVRYIKILRNDPMLMMLIWVGVYCAFLTLTPVAPRYLLLLIPFLYNVSVWVLLRALGGKLLRYF